MGARLAFVFQLELIIRNFLPFIRCAQGACVSHNDAIDTFCCPSVTSCSYFTYYYAFTFVDCSSSCASFASFSPFSLSLSAVYSLLLRQLRPQTHAECAPSYKSDFCLYTLSLSSPLMQPNQRSAFFTHTQI